MAALGDKHIIKVCNTGSSLRSLVTTLASLLCPANTQDRSCVDTAKKKGNDSNSNTISLITALTHSKGESFTQLTDVINDST